MLGIGHVIVVLEIILLATSSLSNPHLSINDCLKLCPITVSIERPPRRGIRRRGNTLNTEGLSYTSKLLADCFEKKCLSFDTDTAYNPTGSPEGTLHFADVLSTTAHA
jgi:hypothetical protein